MKTLWLLLSLACTLNTYAQSAAAQINHDVWFPFIDTYEGFDANGFIALHTDDVIRVDRDESCARHREKQARRSIAFSFLQRLHSDDIAYEVGYYKVIYAAGGQERTSYGKFHVILRRENATWKIAVDSDSSHDGNIYEEQFLAADVLERH